jgi:hypothetical protein
MPVIIKTVATQRSLTALWAAEDLERRRATPMMERTTEALYKALTVHPIRTDTNHDLLTETVSLVYAVLTELLEPTPRMCDAGRQAIMDGSDERGIYRRMIWQADDWRP